MRAFGDYLGRKVHACVRETCAREDWRILSSGVHVSHGTSFSISECLQGLWILYQGCFSIHPMVVAVRASVAQCENFQMKYIEKQTKRKSCITKTNRQDVVSQTITRSFVSTAYSERRSYQMGLR